MNKNEINERIITLEGFLALAEREDRQEEMVRLGLLPAILPRTRSLLAEWQQAQRQIDASWVAQRQATANKTRNRETANRSMACLVAVARRMFHDAPGALKTLNLQSKFKTVPVEEPANAPLATEMAQTEGGTPNSGEAVVETALRAVVQSRADAAILESWRKVLENIDLLPENLREEFELLGFDTAKLAEIGAHVEAFAISMVEQKEAMQIRKEYLRVAAAIEQRLLRLTFAIRDILRNQVAQLRKEDNLPILAMTRL